MRRHPFRSTLIATLAMLAQPVHSQVQAGQTPFNRPASDIGQVALGSLLPATVPYTLSGGLIVIKASIGEGPQYNAALATSLPICIATPPLVSSQTLKANGTKDLPTIAGPVTAANLDPLVIHMGRLVLSGVPFGACDLLGAISKRGLTDGPAIWIGASALASVVTTIDPERKLVTFSAPSTPIPTSAIKVPFEVRDGRMYVKAKFGDKKEVDCLVDTTSSGTMLPIEVGKSLGLTPLATLETRDKANKPVKVAAVEVQQVSLGGAKMNDIQAIYVSEGDDIRSEPSVGILGSEALTKYRVTIHYGLRTLAFEPIKSAQAMPYVPSQPNAVTNGPFTGPFPSVSRPIPKKP